MLIFVPLDIMLMTSQGKNNFGIRIGYFNPSINILYQKKKLRSVSDANGLGSESAVPDLPVRFNVEFSTCPPKLTNLNLSDASLPLLVVSSDVLEYFSCCCVYTSRLT